MNERTEINMMARALREGWISDDEKRAAVLQTLYDIALNEKGYERNRMAAIKGILAAERVAQGWADVELKEKMLDGGGNVNILAVVNELQSAIGSPNLPRELPGPLSE